MIAACSKKLGKAKIGAREDACFGSSVRRY